MTEQCGGAADRSTGYVAAVPVPEGLTEDRIARTPWQQADAWLTDALEAARTGPGIDEPTAMAVATVDAEGLPDVRECLLKFWTPAGPGFISSRHSSKAAHIAVNPVLAGSLTWPALVRAIRFRGSAVEVPPDAVARYWAERPWEARISACASRQSQPVANRDALERAAAECAARWPDHGRPDDVPVPDDCVGYRIECEQVEFWAGRRDRLHDRFRFTRVGPGDLNAPAAWSRVRLQP